MDESLKSQEPWTTPTDVTEASWFLPSLRRAFQATRHLVLAHQAEAVSTCLLLLLAVNLTTAITRKSITNDEIVHIPAGYYHLVAGDFQLNNEHPPLAKMWAALPLLFIQPNEPPMPDDKDANFAARTWGFHQLFWNANKENFLTLSLWPRLMMVPVTLALGLMIFLFARKLFSPRAGVLAVALFTLEPTILAHGRIVHTDVPSALAYLLFFFALYLYSERSTWRNAGFLALATSVALLTKFSMIIVAPILLAYGVARLWSARRNSIARRNILLHAFAVTLTVVLLINVTYCFQHPPLSESDQQWLQTNSKTSAGLIGAGLNVVSHVVPTYFLFGVYNVAIHNKGGHPSSLLGTYGDNGWWYYFPVAFALKTTLPFLLLSVAALLWSFWELLVKRRTSYLWLLVPLAIYSALSLTGHINIGIRHFLPAFPFLFILSGAMLDRLISIKRKLVAIGIVVIALGWMAVEVVRVFPNYTPYMNQLATGPHWWYLSDSNVEWGDDVGDLAAYLKAHGESKVRAALSGGWSTLPQYGIEFISLAPPDEAHRDSRYVAIGASYLNGSTVPYFETRDAPFTPEGRINYFEKYRYRTPEAVFGGSIYLFREHD